MDLNTLKSDPIVVVGGELKVWEVAPQYSALASELGFIFLQECVI